MQQSNVIFANLLIAYLLFITLKGKLPIYITLLRGGGPSASDSAAVSGGPLASADKMLADSLELSDSFFGIIGNKPANPAPASAYHYITNSFLGEGIPGAMYPNGWPEAWGN